MNKQQTYKLLDDTFNHDFDVSTFSKFLKELLNTSDLHQDDKTNYIRKEFRDYIEKLIKIGQYKDNKGKTIEILAIKLTKHSSLERARTMQRNFIAKWLSNNPNEPEGAIVAFYDDTKDWRFSFVKLEYNLIKDKKGNLKAEKELTPAKRYSFLVGPNEPNHTCKKQFVDILIEDNDNPLLEEIEKAFSIEKVTKEFFEKYKDLYLKLKTSLFEVVNNDDNVRFEFEKIVGNDKEELDKFYMEFSKKLLGQIVFLYFLQKKGWMGVQKGSSGRFKDWGTGPKDFMKKLFDKKYGDYKNFFNDILEPLFYNTLAVKRSDDYSDKFNCKIPFLNGGLFEPLENYDWMNTNIYLDNSIFKTIFKTFDDFNFTVKEDEPLEREVAVDPEMLGKVFENLLEISDRKSKGAFYTQREIVHYMCQQSLINYIETNTKISRKDIETFIQGGDLVLDQTIRANVQKKRYGGKTDVDTKILPKSIENNYEQIDKLLQNIKVVDPAVGSGAFPIGMMNEIVKARSILSIFFETDRNVYDLKRHCIENNLYGVDIMPSAVDICQLRFWLSLIVDEVDKDKVKPLPNLDNKIMCGNSLLEEFEGVKLFDESLLGEEVKNIRPELDRINNEIKEFNLKVGKITLGKNKGNINDIKKSLKKLEKEKKKLTEIKKTGKNSNLMNFDKVQRDNAKIKLNELNTKQKEFINEYDRDKKLTLKKEIDNIEWELIEVTLREQGNENALKKLENIKNNKSKPFFLWKLYFSEVFHRDNPGFDVVIGNPPYISQKNMKRENKEQIPALNNTYYNNKRGNKYICKFKDIYELFFYRGFDVLRNNGSFAFICSDSYLCTNNFEGLREFILSKNIIYWLPCPIDTFKSGDGSPSVSTSVMIMKNNNKNNILTCYKRSKSIKNIDIKFKMNISKNKYYSSIRKSLWIPTEFNNMIFEKIIFKMKKNNKIKLFESFVEGYSRMETPNNSEFIAVLNTDKKYSDNAKKYQNKFGKDINKLSEFGKLHGKVWKIIKKTDITEIKNLSDEQKKNGVSGKWIKFIKGSGISALEPNKRWKSKMHYYINWDSNIIKEYNMAGSQYFWSKGIYWSLATESKEKGFLINPDSRLKFSLKDEGPNDVNFKAAIINDKNYILYLLGVLNTKLIFKIKFNFINSSTANQQCDINLIPIIIPNEEDKKFIEDRVKKCIMIQEDIKNTSKKDIEKIEDEIENRVLKIYDLIPK